MIGNALENVSSPVTDKACNTPTVAEALCRTAVNTIPTRIPMTGFENVVNRSINTLLSRSGATAPLMVCIPVMRIANPSMMSPIFRWTVLLLAILRIIPITATTAAIVADDRILAIPLDPSI